MEMRKESGRATKVRELQEYIVHAVVFTAGAAVLMAAFLKRVILLVFLMEQWRAWVFIVLNLIRVAVFFTSISSTSNTDHNQQRKNNNNAEVIKNIGGEKKRREYYRCPSSLTFIVLKEFLSALFGGFGV